MNHAAQPTGREIHQQVRSSERDELWVDAGMVALLDELFRAGCSTLHSCQGDAGGAYITFASSADLERASAHLGALARSADDPNLALRVLGMQAGAFGSNDTWVEVGAETELWSYRLAWTYSDWNEGVGSGALALRATVRFPSADLKLITSLIENATDVPKSTPR